MDSNYGPEYSKEATTAPLSVTSSGVFQAQDILDPLWRIADDYSSADQPISPRLFRFYRRFVSLAILIVDLRHQRIFASNDNLLRLLEGSCRIKLPTDAANQGKPYPSLNLLATVWSNGNVEKQQRLRTILQKIDVHWGTPQHQEHLLTEMDNYSKEGEIGLGTDSTTTWTKRSKQDQPRSPYLQAKNQADSVFHALDDCRKACGCNRSVHDYHVRLALETQYHEEMASYSRSTLHILTNPESGAWQEAYVETLSGSHLEELSSCPHQYHLNSGFKPTERLCNLIKDLEPEEVQLQLRIVKGQVLMKADFNEVRYSAAQLDDPISLQTLIEGRGNLGERLELTIAIKLARAALYLEKGPWMKTAWGKESIQFLRTSDQEIPPRPFFLTRISSDDIPHHAQQSEIPQHPDIGLLALGIMLLELRLGRKIESLAVSGQAGNGGVGNRNPLLVAKKVYRKFENGFSEDFRHAINACLDIGFGDGDCAERVDDEEFAGRIKDNIIAPLEREFAHFCRVEVLSRDFENALQYGRQNVLEKPPMVLETVSQNSTNTFPSAEASYNRTAASTPISPGSGFMDDEKSADKFMRKQLDVYNRVINNVQAEEDEIVRESVGLGALEEERRQVLSNLKFPQPGYRIRVAVLDTGIHAQHRLFPEDRIKDIKTWLDGANGEDAPNGGDEDGHGTHVAHLVLKVARDSDLYVARIARKDVPENSLQISKAVMHAVNEWKVDIITMSFGMTREEEVGREELRAALDTAKSAGVLLFAAASNEGGSMHRAFPARLPSVFCVHGTDGLGNPCAYNPTPEENQFNLATLGKEIEAAWPYFGGGSGLMRKSGTSFATPIAAGFAAVVLFYARQRLPDKAKVFKWDDRMRGVFERTSSRFGRRGGYNYFSLDMLLDRPHQHIVSDLLQIADD